MAKHSHWSQIKYKKAIQDAKKSQMIGKLINAIIIAAREGNDPESNPKLRSAISRAKEFNVPQENIERAIQKGFKKEDNLEEVLYEAHYGEIQLLIKALTDNKNRTLGEVKHLLNKYNAKMGEPGSVKWNFEEKGIIRISKQDENKISETLDLIQDIEEKNGDILLTTDIDALSDLKKKLEEKDVKINEVFIDFKPINKVKCDKKEIVQLIDELLDLEDVEEVFTNIIE